MQLCSPTLGLEKFVESYERIMHFRAPEFYDNPDDPHAPRPEYVSPQRQKNWSILSESARATAIFEDEFRTTRHPLWQEVSGMFSRLPKHSPITMRETQTSKLALAVYHLIGAELKREDETPNLAHTTFWDPIRKICHQLEIAKSKLDAFSRESIGMSTNEMVDRHRVAKIKTHWYKDFFPIAEAWSQSLKPHALDRMPTRDAKFALLKYLRAHRRESGTDRAALALSLRIPTFARLHRACMIHHGQTPLQIELETLDQLIRELKNPSVPPASRPDPTVPRASRPESASAAHPHLVQKNTATEPDESAPAHPSPPAEGGADHSCLPADTPPTSPSAPLQLENPHPVQKNTEIEPVESQEAYEARLIKEFSQEYGFDIEAAWGRGNEPDSPEI